MIASSDDGGKKVTVICHYDTGYYSGTEKAAVATFNVSVKLPAGWYRLVRRDADWTDRKVGDAGERVQGTVVAGVTLKPCSAVALTWVRQ